jgi:2-dehydropantoate 2-reductase
VARGAHLEAMQARGLTLKQGGEQFTVHPRVSDDPAALGPQDYVVVALKAHALPAAIPGLKALQGPDTAFLFAQNGLPWWYFYRHGGPHDGHRLATVDPGGRLWNELGPEAVLGCVVWQAAELEAPGIVVHAYGDRMPLAEPSGEKTPRAEILSRLLTEAGIKSPIKTGLRNEIWLKLWGNLSFNPVSVLTAGTLAGLAGDAGTRRVIAAMMAEAKDIAEDLGVTFPVSITERIDMAARVGDHKTSMLQDVEARRPTELEALLGVVIELGQLTGRSTPALQMIYDLAKYRTRTS